MIRETTKQQYVKIIWLILSKYFQDIINQSFTETFELLGLDLVCACNHRYTGGISLRITVSGQAREKVWDATWKINESEKGWGYGSSDSV
jgi:hypothetical protein